MRTNVAVPSLPRVRPGTEEREVDDPERRLGSGTWVVGPEDEPAMLRVRKCRLEVVAGPDAGLACEFAAPVIVIGRAGADLVLSDRKVSSVHAEIRLEEHGYRIRDIGSRNGTFVRSMRVVEGFLSPGATIVIGESAVRFVPLADSVAVPLWGESRLAGLVGHSALMRGLFQQINRIAQSDTTVLITGETGSGKELVAEAIHERSPRAGGPFVVLDCGAIPANLFEDTLFGHEAGAFTDARKAALGMFEAAHGGTLFLDEIGELPVDVQPKLLRAVETLRIRRIGGDRAIDCDVRVIAATNRDLAAEVNRKAFRADLYFRVAVGRLTVPPLRDRREDIPALVQHFVAQLPSGRPLPDAFFVWALDHPWPGNVRELRNAVERAITTRAGTDFAERPATNPGGEPAPVAIDTSVPFKEAKRRLVDDFDRRYLESLLDEHDGNIAAAARAAGLDRMSIYKMLQRLDLQRAPR